MQVKLINNKLHTTKMLLFLMSSSMSLINCQQQNYQSDIGDTYSSPGFDGGDIQGESSEEFFDPMLQNIHIYKDFIMPSGNEQDLLQSQFQHRSTFDTKPYQLSLSTPLAGTTMTTTTSATTNDIDLDNVLVTQQETLDNDTSSGEETTKSISSTPSFLERLTTFGSLMDASLEVDTQINEANSENNPEQYYQDRSDGDSTIYSSLNHIRQSQQTASSSASLVNTVISSASELQPKLRNDSDMESTQQLDRSSENESDTDEYTADELQQTTILTTLIQPQPVPATRMKQGKQIRIYRRSADELLRAFLEDPYIRSPLAALFDTSPNALSKSKILWKAALRLITPMDIVLVAYNSTGVGVTFTFNNTRSMLAGLDSLQPSKQPSIAASNNNNVQMNGANAFYGIIRSSELIPYDSAIFISTDELLTDNALAHSAALALLKKRIRLYLIWFGNSTLNENETIQSSTGGILGEVALRSGGEILHVTDEAFSPNGDIGMITLFVRNDLKGPESFEILTTDSTLSNSYFKTQGYIDTATFETTPNGDFYVETFDPKNFREFSLYNNEKSNLIVPNLRNKLNEKLDDLNVEENGSFFERQIRFPENNNGENFNDTETISINEHSAKQSNTLQTISRIELSTQSQLLATPGSQVQIYYEVTNLRDEPSYHNFRVSDEMGYLRSLIPQNILLAAGQTTSVVVTAYVPATAEIGSRDKITLTSQGVGLTSQSAFLTVTANTASQDTTLPNLYFGFGSRCEGKSGPGTCAGAVWSLEVSAQDYDTGILRIQSTPKGIWVRNSFSAGTRETVVATYTASCCQPRVTVIAYDVAGNQRSVTVDVTEFYLNEASIAAIVLGVILLILLIVIIIVLICWCVKRKKASRELPSYRSDRGISGERRSPR